MDETAVPSREEYLEREDDLLRGLLEAAERDRETITIEIARKGRVYFRFRIRPLTETEYEECRRKATRWQRDARFGAMRVPEGLDLARYRAMLIYAATVEEDRARLWDNRAAWERLNVLNAYDLIDRVLLAGEKDAVVAKIDEISGFGADLEEQAKN